jgi:hypothetical protein
MKRFVALAAVAVALAAPVSAAHATGSKTFDFCGGSYSGYTGFAFCASVSVSVAPATEPGAAANAYTVTLDIANRSGLNGSYAGTVFVQMGLDNLINTLAMPTNLTVSQGGNVICTNNLNITTGKAKCYDIQEDHKVAGGVKLDFALQTSTGNGDLGIWSACSGAKAGLYTCDILNPVRISFDVTTDFNPNDGTQVYVKGQGQLGSTECETVTGSMACVPTTTAPEPASLALLGTGFVGLGIPALRRRKRAAELKS